MAGGQGKMGALPRALQGASCWAESLGKSRKRGLLGTGCQVAGTVPGRWGWLRPGNRRRESAWMWPRGSSMPPTLFDPLDPHGTSLCSVISPSGKKKVMCLHSFPEIELVSKK